MTIAEKITQDLESCGLRPDEATAMLKALQDSRDIQAMTGRWNEQIEAYPKLTLTILLAYVRHKARAWLEAKNRAACLKSLAPPTEERF